MRNKARSCSYFVSFYLSLSMPVFNKGVLIVFASAGLGTIVAAGCGVNRLKPKAPQSLVEEAQLLLEEGEFMPAREKLETYLEENPDDTKAIGLLAATYALEAGISIVELTESALNSESKSKDGGAEASGNASQGNDKGREDFIESILPEPTEENIAAVKKARTLILSIPTEARDADIEFGETIYVTAYALMLFKKLTKQDTPPTAQDAVEIITSIDVAVDLAAKNNVPAEKISKVKDELANEPGSTDDEKLKSYLAKLKAKEAQSNQSAPAVP